MGDVPPGLYEHLVTDRLAADLAATTPDLIQLGTLDPAGAHETLTPPIAELARPAPATSLNWPAVPCGQPAAETRRPSVGRSSWPIESSRPLATSPRTWLIRTTPSSNRLAPSWRSLCRAASRAPCRSRTDRPSRCRPAPYW